MSNYNRESSGRFNPAIALISPIAPRTLSTKAFAMPWLLLALLVPPDTAGPSLPIVGKTLSLAERLTNSENGTNHTHRPKYDAISVKVGTLLGTS